MNVFAAAASDGDIYVAQNIFFGIIAATMIVAALRCVTTKNVVHAALWLVLVLGGAATQFILLGSEFVAVTQVLVYVGAIVVLFLFGIMLTRASWGDDENTGVEKRAMAVVVAVLLLVVMGGALIESFEDTRLVIDEPQRTRDRVGLDLQPVHRRLRGGVGSPVGRPHRGDSRRQEGLSACC